MKIIFLGTPDFAVPSLKALHAAGFEVVAVVTAPDRPAGRGMQLRQSPVKVAALELNIPVLQPEKLRNPEFLEQLKGFHADLQVVIAFRMLPESVWKMPPLGTMNLHASLLPDYRGAAPINRAIMNGERKTGVTTFLLKHEVDTGDWIDQMEVSIGDEMTATELHDKLMQVGAEVVLQSVRKIKNGNVETHPQGEPDPGKVAPKIFTEDCRIDWTRDGESVRNQIRGLADYPCAFTLLNGKKCKIFRAEFHPVMEPTHQPGECIVEPKKHIGFTCADGWIELLELQMEGKRRMTSREFMIGFKHN